MSVEEKTIFKNTIVYWVIVVALAGGLLLSVYALTKGFNLITNLHLIWMAALLFLIVTKHKHALSNLKWWLILSFIAGPAFSLAGRFLNEMLDGFSSFSVEFYLYRALMILLGLILVNYIRSTVRVEKADVN